MPAPTTHTEDTLKQFIVDELGAVATALSLTTASAQVVNAVYAVQRLLSLDDVADATDMTKVETLARWRAWMVAKAAGVPQYDIASQGDSLDRSQFYDHIAAMLSDAEAAASQYEEAAALIYGSTATVTGSSVAGSPYGWATCTTGGW